MDEKRPLQILSKAHLDPHAAPGKSDNRRTLKRDDHNIKHGKKADARKCVSLNKMVDGIALKQRKDDIHQGTEQVHDQDHNYRFFVGFEKRKDPFPDGVIKGFCVFFFFQSHAFFPPSMTRMSLFI